MPRKTVRDKPHLEDRGPTRISTSLPWGGTQQEFNNTIYQTRARLNIDQADRTASHENDEEAAANERAVLENQRYFRERPPENPRRRQR